MENVLDYILDGLEAALELERELGVRTVECDRGLLGASADTSRLVSKVSRPPVAGLETLSERRETRTEPEARDARPVASDLVFLHDRPLSPAGVEMMAKIIGAMKRTAENTPIVVAPPVPQAKITVVLGGLALKKYFPEMKAEPGQWQKTPDGRDVLVTYSPAYILRFDTVTPAVDKMKHDMWRSLKAVVQRLES